jgi:hypothetical protein
VRAAVEAQVVHRADDHLAVQCVGHLLDGRAEAAERGRHDDHVRAGRVGVAAPTQRADAGLT